MGVSSPPETFIRVALRDRIDRFLRPADHDSRIVEQAPAVAAAEVVRRFWPFARPYRRWIAFGLFLLVLVPAIDAVEIYLFKLVVDDVLVPQELAALVPIALAYLGLALLGAIASFGDEYVATWVGERFLLDLRAKVYAHVQSLSPAQVGRKRVGDLLARLTGDVAAIETLVLSVIGEGVSAVARILFFTTALFVLSWQLALAALVVAPLFFLLARRFGRRVRHAAREKRRRTGSLSAVAEETLNAAPLVHSLNRQDAEVERFKRENASIMEAEMAATRISGLFGPLVGLIELLGGMLVIVGGVLVLQSGTLSLGGLLVFFTYLAQLYSPIRSLGSLSNEIFSAAAGAERVLELLDEPPAVADAPHARPLVAPVRGQVALHAVCFAHPGADRLALREVTLDVAPGEIVALVGPSGSGKSTLASLLVRFADPQTGSIALDGHDLRDVTLESLRAHVGLLLQDTMLLDMTAREAIAQGRDGATAEEVAAAARAATVEHLLDARTRELSGGQRRRVAIARAFVRDTPVLVLDEPTTGLDETARDALLEPVQRLARGRTTILITHDPAVAGWADRVLELHDGALVQGAPA